MRARGMAQLQSAYLFISATPQEVPSNWRNFMTILTNHGHGPDATPRAVCDRVAQSIQPAAEADKSHTVCDEKSRVLASVGNCLQQESASQIPLPLDRGSSLPSRCPAVCSKRAAAGFLWSLAFAVPAISIIH